MIDLPIGLGFFSRHLTIRRLVWATVLFHVIRAISTVTLNAQGAHLNDLSAQVRSLQTDNQALEVEIAQVNSLQHLQQFATSYNLVPATGVNFAGTSPSSAKSRR